MKPAPFIPICAAAAVLLLAGCNGTVRTSTDAGGRTVRPPDPAFQAALKRYEEQRVTWHVMQKGETFYSLSQKYGVPVAAISVANPQLDPRNIGVGQKVAVPGFGPADVKPPVAPVPTPVASKPPPVKTRDRGRFCYPVAGTARDPKGPTPGVEFSVPAGATVVAAHDGRVVVATPDLGGLGPTVIIDHGNGLCTLYGRLADFAVKTEQKVGRGEAIGRASAVALVFRVYEGPVAREPAGYLNKK